MRIFLATFLFILALPPFEYTIAGMLFLLPILFNAEKIPANIIAFNAAAAGLIISSYIFLGAWTYSPFVYLAIIVLFSISLAGFCLLSQQLLRLNPYIALVLSPGIWVSIELIFNHFHVPISLALLLTGDQNWLGLAGITGQHSLSAIVILIQISLIILINTNINRRHNNVIAAFILFISAGALMLGSNKPDSPDEEHITISIAQTNAHPADTLALASDNMIEQFSETRSELLSLLSSKGTKPDLVVWPEVNLAKYEFRHKTNTTALAKQYNVAMLVASPDLTPTGNSLSSVFSVSSKGETLQRSSKNILIPFIEDDHRIPTSWQPHTSLPGSPGSIICYESAFTAPAVRLAANNAGFLSIATNEAYAGPSLLSLVHLNLAKLRAVETAKTVVRAANGGPSAIILPDGTISQILPEFTQGLITQKIKPSYSRTFYVSHFDTINIILTFIASTSLILGLTLVVRRYKLPLKVSYKPRWTTSALTIASLFVGLNAFQYLYACNQYISSNPAGLPDGFIHFQNGFRSDSYSFTNLKASNEQEALSSAITYLLRDHGLQIKNDTINKKLQLLASQTTSTGDPVKHLMEQYNYSAVYATLENIEPATYDDIGPCLTVLNNGEIIVLIDLTSDHASFFSPYHGEILSVRYRAFSEKWTRKIIKLLPREMPWDT